MQAPAGVDPQQRWIGAAEHARAAVEIGLDGMDREGLDVDPPRAGRGRHRDPRRGDAGEHPADRCAEQGAERAAVRQADHGQIVATGPERVQVAQLRRGPDHARRGRQRQVEAGGDLARGQVEHLVACRRDHQRLALLERGHVLRRRRGVEGAQLDRLAEAARDRDHRRAGDGEHDPAVDDGGDRRAGRDRLARGRGHRRQLERVQLVGGEHDHHRRVGGEADRIDGRGERHRAALGQAGVEQDQPSGVGVGDVGVVGARGQGRGHRLECTSDYVRGRSARGASPPPSEPKASGQQ